MNARDGTTATQASALAANIVIVEDDAQIRRFAKVRVYMGHLRKKIEIDPSRPRHLLTEAGIGYRFVF